MLLLAILKAAATDRFPGRWQSPVVQGWYIMLPHRGRVSVISEEAAVLAGVV